MQDTINISANESGVFYTATELLKHGYTFGELMSLAEQGIVRRRHRVNAKRDDIFTFCESDLISYRNMTEVEDGGAAR